VIEQVAGERLAAGPDERPEGWRLVTAELATGEVEESDRRGHQM
jgi:hypothetical protein